MTAAQNKKLMQEIYARVAERDGALFVEHLADHAVWRVTGQYSWSHAFEGKDAILKQHQRYFRSLLAERPRTVAYNFIADGDYVVIEANGDNVTKAGQRYDNDYCMVFRLEDGKIVEIKEYCDSDLVERILGQFPEDLKPIRAAAE